jgi:hypothetical protein
MAWRSVRKQIASQRKIESDRKRHDRRVLETGLTAELHSYSASIIEATSCWNVRALEAPDAPVSASPQFLRPRVYEAVIKRIGLLSEGWPAAAVIGFYGNLLELNDMAAEPVSSPHTIGENTRRIAQRLQKMAINLAQALDGLNANRMFVVPAEIDLHQLVAPDGSVIGNDATAPTSLQELLLRLGGQPVVQSGL